ncbi:MAG: hypothetical protein Q4B95_08160 [Lonepinella koalarum]|nr:hypothetical protein [Lonepinella koalarum]
MIINSEDLINTDYKIVEFYNPYMFSFSEIIDDIINNEYSRLENFYKHSFEFIKFKDEEVIVENSKNEKSIVFGKNNLGFFLINEEKEVWLIPFNKTQKSNPIFINSSLYQFRRCYSLLLSILFLLLSKNFDEIGYKKIANNFMKDIEIIDKKSIKSHFYINYASSIYEMEIELNFNPMIYVNANRHNLPK